MDKQQTVNIARKVESLAIGFIGVFFFCMGTSYFQERFLYRVPRILIPVFDIFGYIGLAVGLLILGGGLIYYGFTKWKEVSDNRKLYLILAAAGLVVGVVLANVDFNPNKSADIMEEMENRRDAEIDNIRNSDELSFSNAEIDSHIAHYNTLYKRYEQSLKDQNEEDVMACENELNEWVLKTGEMVQNLAKMDEKTELARYQAKLLIQWNDLKGKYSE